MNYRKEDHIEFSDGDTAFISVKACPLTEAEIKADERVLSDNDIVCCKNSDKDFMCPHFFKFLMTNDGTRSIQCSAMNTENINSSTPKFVEL
jgi:hypothetical protein